MQEVGHEEGEATVVCPWRGLHQTPLCLLLRLAEGRAAGLALSPLTPGGASLSGTSRAASTGSKSRAPPRARFSSQSNTATKQREGLSPQAASWAYGGSRWGGG